MLIIPHSTALDLEGHAYTTYAVAILCIIIFYFQFNNEKEVDTAIWNYCDSVYSPSLSNDSIDIMKSDTYICENILSMFHTNVDFLLTKKLEFSISYRDKAELDDIIQLIEQHYVTFRNKAPESLNAKLMYYPYSPSPIKMITSSLSHGDIYHISGNLIFFLAFAPALELLIGNLLKYLGVMLIITLATSISYSLAVLIAGTTALPTLGLSGVVMGMIGLSAYLMPKAKIRVFVWWFTFARNFYISAWILAVWYIGWDTWDLLNSSDHGGVNLIAHVSGGIAGYLIGVFWLKETRDDTSDELADEIEYQRSKRADKYTTQNISFRGNRQYIANKQQQREFKKNNDEYMSRLYQFVKCKNNSEAIVLILDDYDFQRVHVENYEDLFKRINEWGPSRTSLCMGRVCISLLLEQRLYIRALKIFKQCHNITADFVLADPNEVLLLAQGLIKLQQYEAARDLINNSEKRYGKYIDVPRFQLLEIKLLLHHLNKLEEARDIMNILLSKPQGSYKKEILSLAKLMATL